MTRRKWQELTDDPADIGIHLGISRQHPHRAAGQASTRVLLKHYRAACEKEMLAHHGHVHGYLRKEEFLARRVDSMLEDWANWLKRKILLADDPAAETARLIGDLDQPVQKPKKTQEEKRLGGIKF